MNNLLISIGDFSYYIFENLKQYFAETFVVEEHLKNGFSMQNFEEKAQEMPLSILFNKPESYDKILVLITGSDSISGCSLTILEYFKDREITIIYIKSDLQFLDQESIINDRIANQVLQEQTRSGLFERIFLIDLSLIDSYIENISISDYSNKISEMISKVLYNILWISGEKPLVGKILKTNLINRISTIGYFDLNNKIIYPFYKLDFIKECEYYFLLSNKEVLENKSVLKTIKSNLTDLTSNLGSDKTKLTISYGVYETQYNDNFYFCKFNTNIVQNSLLTKEE